MYSDTQAIALLQEIGITNANDEVRFLTRGPIYKESKVSSKCGVGRFADSTHFPSSSFLPFHLSLPFPATSYTAGYLGIIPHP